MRKHIKMLFKLMLGSILLSCLSPTHFNIMAAEINYPVPCYQGDELKKVRQWEQKWAGNKIDATNIDKIKDLLPDTYYELYKNTEKWGENWFKIVPYRQIKPTKGLLEATQKYNGVCSIGPKSELHNWVAGIPFPNPKNAIEIGQNFSVSENHGDNVYKETIAKVVDGVKRYDRNVGFKQYYMWFIGRTEIPPIPAITPNPKGIWRAHQSEWVNPATLRGSRLLNIKWVDESKDYGMWEFSFGTRRVMRKTTAARQDMRGGADNCADDERVFDYTLSVMKLKLLGRKEYLLPRHVNAQEIWANHKEGHCIDSGAGRERINAYIVEAVHKDPNYLYSRQVWYIDPETWWIIYAEKYDREGKLWKIFDYMQTTGKLLTTGEEIPWLSYATTVDVQRSHSTTGLYADEKLGTTGAKWRQSFYAPDGLLKYGY